MAHPNDLAAVVEQSHVDVWVAHAACGDLELDQLDMFFVDAGRTLSSEAAALCRTCPVRSECLEHAYAREISGGYFGGMSPSKRRAGSRAELVAD